VSACRNCGQARAERLPFHYRWHGRRFDGVRCRACDLVRLDPMPAAAELEELYGQDYFDTALHGLDQAGMDYEALHDAQRVGTAAFVAQDLLPRAPGAASFFEVGAAMGHLLSCARDLGLRVGGVEISAAACAAARRKFGLELHRGDVTALDLTDEAGRWDVVYAGDVLEHMTEPAAALAAMHALLAPGGTLILRVPATLNLLSTRVALTAYRLLGRSVRLPDGPYHVHEFTPRTLARTVGRRFTDVRVEQDIVPLRDLNLKGGSAAYRAKWLLHAVNVPLTRLTGRLGDRLLLTARKG